MRKIFTFLFAALMSVGVWADPNIVTPTISGDLSFTESTTVTMECASPNADIYYTTDGVTDPKCDCAAAPEYKQPITITETTIIKAAAYDGNDWSAVAEVTFTKVTAPAWVKPGDEWDDATKTLTVNGNPVSKAYRNVNDIENLVISDAVTSIGDNAFESCTFLKSVVFGSSLANIGKGAFASCIKLDSVTFPASLKSIGNSAFSQCYALTSVTITNGLESIVQGAFYNCEKLASVTIPSSVTSIGMNAFGNCEKLTEIVVAAENPNYSSADGVLFDKAKTTLIKCPGGKQGEYTIPNSVTSIDTCAFSSCYLLTSVEIPNSVEEIGVQAFSSCIELTSVTIPSSVTSIGGYAFYYCSKLASVTINATTPPTIGSQAFGNTAASLTIYVPAASVTDYKGAWTAYADKIVAAASTTYTLQLVVNDTTMGAVAIENPSSDIVKNEDGSYSVPEGLEVSIKATAKEGYRFAGWREGNVDELNCYYCGTALNTQDNPYKVKLTADKAIMAVFEKKPELARLWVNLPAESQPAADKIEMVGSFDEGKAVMEKLIETGWFISNDFVNATAESTFKFRDASNENKVLCKFIPSNEGEGKWVQAIFKFGNYWKDDIYKGTPCKSIELDISDGAQYGWKENAPLADTLKLQLAINDSAMGTVAVSNLLGSGIISLGEGKYTVPEDVEVSILATANKGYKLASWKEGDTTVNTKDNPWKTYISKDVTITAVFEIDDQAIDEVQSDKVQSTKILRDGQLLIEKDGKLFNVTGAQVK